MPMKSTFTWILQQVDDLAVEGPKTETLSAHELQAKADLQKWLTEGPGVFHISGKPGSGKSTLMKYIFESETTGKLLLQWAKPHELVSAKFFLLATRDTQSEIHGRSDSWSPNFCDLASAAYYPVALSRLLECCSLRGSPAIEDESYCSSIQTSCELGWGHREISLRLLQVITAAWSSNS